MRKLIVGLLFALCVPAVVQAQPPSLTVPYVSANRATPGSITLDTTTANAFRVQMGTPAAPTVVASQLGTNLAAGVYKITVVALDPIGGVTFYPAAASCTVTAGGTGRCAVTYTAVTGAVSYRVYTSDVGGATPDRYFASTSSPYNLDTLTGATVAALPTAASAYRSKLGGATASWTSVPFYFPDGTAAASSMAFASEPGLGIYRIGANAIGIGLDDGTTGIRVDNSGLIFNNAHYLRWGSSGFGSPDIYLGRESAAVLKLGIDAAGVTDQTIKGPDRITSDGLGGSVYFAGGRPRGASAGGLIGFQTAPPTTAGSAGVLETVATIDTLGSILARESFDQPHLIRLSTTFAAKGLGDGATNAVLGSPPGVTLYREEQAKTVSSWVDTTGALNLDADAINDEGVEIALGDSEAGASGWIITGAATGGCFIVNFTLGDNAGTDQFFVGWRNVTAFVTDNVFSGYNEWAGLGINAVDGSIFANHEINGGGGSLSDDSGVNVGDGETRTLKSCITGTTRVPTASYTANSGTTFTAITLTNGGGAQTTGIPMIPFISYINAASVDPGLFVNWWQITRQ